MSTSDPSFDARDEINGRFLQELHAAGDPGAVLAKYRAAHPDRGEEFAELARVEGIFASSSVPAGESYPVPPTRAGLIALGHLAASQDDRQGIRLLVVDELHNFLRAGLPHQLQELPD